MSCDYSRFDANFTFFIDIGRGDDRTVLLYLFRVAFKVVRTEVLNDLGARNIPIRRWMQSLFRETSSGSAEIRTTVLLFKFSKITEKVGSLLPSRESFETGLSAVTALQEQWRPGEGSAKCSGGALWRGGCRAAEMLSGQGMP